jgi:hypothetical protein
MKNLIIGLMVFSMLSCAQGYQDNNNQSNPNRPQVQQQTQAPVGGVQHYICPNNCAGSGGPGEGVCPTCGTAYIHNQAFHDQPQMQQQAPPPVSGVQHYICPNNCAGTGGPGEGVCPACGTAYIHNQAFHEQQNNGFGNLDAVPQQNPAPGNQPLSPLFQNQSGQVSATNINTPSALSVSAGNPGVFHYVCSKGCAGGSGGAGNCSRCGAELAHNAAFHNN